MDDTLDILNGITVAVTVSFATVLEGSCSGPGKGNETLVSVPCVNHAVEGSTWSVNLEVSKLCVPILL